MDEKEKDGAPCVAGDQSAGGTLAGNEHLLWPTIGTTASVWASRNPGGINPSDLVRDTFELVLALAGANGPHSEGCHIEPSAFCATEGLPFANFDNLIWHMWGQKDKDPAFTKDVRMSPCALNKYFATEEGSKWLSIRGLSGSAPATAQAAPTRKAHRREIHQAIGAVYDEAERTGKKPPNVAELIAPVRKQLSARHLITTQAMIKTAADEHQHKSRRLRQGERQQVKAS